MDQNQVENGGLPVLTANIDGKETIIKLGDAALVDEFHKQIGFLIARWAHIDRQVFECVHKALDTKEENSAAIFYRFQSQSQRLELADEIISNHNLGSLNAEWNTVLKEMKRLLPMRNFVAHQPLIFSSTVTNVSHLDPANPLKIENFASVQIEEKRLLRDKAKTRKVEITELFEANRETFALENEIRRFADELKARQ